MVGHPVRSSLLSTLSLRAPVSATTVRPIRTPSTLQCPSPMFADVRTATCGLVDHPACVSAWVRTSDCTRFSQGLWLNFPFALSIHMFDRMIASRPRTRGGTDLSLTQVPPVARYYHTILCSSLHVSHLTSAGSLAFARQLGVRTLSATHCRGTRSGRAKLDARRVLCLFRRADLRSSLSPLPLLLRPRAVFCSCPSTSVQCICRSDSASTLPSCKLSRS